MIRREQDDGCSRTATLAPQRALVLGGTGFIGSQVARALVDAGSAVRALARRAPILSPASPGVEFVQGSAEDPGVMHQALEGVDVVVHALGCPPPAASSDDLVSAPQNIPVLDALLEALRARPGVGLTFVSSGGAVYGDVTHLPVHEDTRCRPLSAYGLAKLMAEDSITAYSARYGIPVCILRVANAYGPGQNCLNGQGLIAALLEAASTGRSVPVFDGGRAVRDFVHVDDVAAAVVAARPRTSEPQVVNVGSGVGHSVAQVLEVVEQITGTRLEVQWLPRRPSDVHAIVMDVRRLREIMPWHPRDLETGVAEIWDARTTGDGTAPHKLTA